MTDLRLAADAPGTSVAARRLAARPVLRRAVAGRAEPQVPAPDHGGPATPPTADRVSTAPGHGATSGSATAPPAHGVWTAGREHTATLARVGVWLLVLSGPVSLIWLATSRPGVAPAPPPAVAADPGPESAVAAAGEAAALDWLVAGGGSGAAGPAVTVDVTPPADPAAAGPQVWSVLVAVAGGTADSTPTYLQVPLVVEAGGDALPAISALGQPAIVPGPAQAVAGPPSDYGTVLALTDPRAATAAAFVTALLTGGDVTPLTSPGSSVRAVAPPPATRVEVRSVVTTDGADAAAVEVSVTAELTSSVGAGATGDPAADSATGTEPAAGTAPPAGTEPAAGTAPPAGTEPAADAATNETTRTATYYLALASRDGRWEISALRPGPVVTASAAEPAQRTPADPPADPAPAD